MVKCETMAATSQISANKYVYVTAQQETAGVPNQTKGPKILEYLSYITATACNLIS